ncbi:MAG: lyase family protein [Parasutterella excrementihominis]
MTLRVTPWGKDNFKATSEEAEAKDWAYWQNRLNRASLVMLAEEGIIKGDVASRIAAAQKHSEDLQNQPDVPRLTDIMPLEKMLIETCGEEATLIHTGRSRQDMFTTLNEARLRLAVLDFYEALNRLRTRLLLIARENIETYIPAYTNGVQAMPITLAFYLWGFLDSFQRDSDRIIESYKRINQSALGVAVLACSSWPLNRERLAELLGFEKPLRTV